MDKELVLTYLMDIKNSEFRLKQVNYVLAHQEVEESFPTTSWGDNGSSYTVSNPTEKAIVSVFSTREMLTLEKAELEAKLAVYNEWIGYVTEPNHKELLAHIYLERKSARSFQEKFFIGWETFYRWQKKIFAILVQHPIEVEITVIK